MIVGSYNSANLDSPDGSVYQLNPDNTLHKIDSGIVTSNGIGLSPDGKTLYVTEMFANKITAYDYNIETGDVSNRRTFVDIPKDAGMPDGLTVDSEGFIWSAHWGGWRVSRFDPSGNLEREIKVPVELVTCIGFGGDNMNELYITTAWYQFNQEQRKEQPLAGDLFKIETDITGLAEPSFSG